MKQRVITGLVLIAILIPIFLLKFIYDYSGILYILGLILAIVATNEMISMKEKERVLPPEIHLLSYLSVVYLIFYNTDILYKIPEKFQVDIIPLIFIILAIVMVFRKHFKITDASFILFAIVYLGLAFHSLVLILDSGYQFLYIVLIAMLTDTFAYFVGKSIGKHKLCPSISPNKTIEGSVGGTVIATTLASVYAIYISTWTNTSFMADKSVFYIIIMTIVLSILSQIGDLLASVMKRHYKIKDYGNLFPGHGGVLDRLDSILFTSLTFLYLTELIAIIF